MFFSNKLLVREVTDASRVCQFRFLFFFGSKRIGFCSYCSNFKRIRKWAAHHRCKKSCTEYQSFCAVVVWFGSSHPLSVRNGFLLLPVCIARIARLHSLVGKGAVVPNQILRQHRNSGTLYTSSILTLRTGTLFGAGYEQRSYGRNKHKAQVNHGRSKSCFKQHLQNQHTLGEFKKRTECMLPLVTNWGPNLLWRRIMYIHNIWWKAIGYNVHLTSFAASCWSWSWSEERFFSSDILAFWKIRTNTNRSDSKKWNVDYHVSHNRIQITRGTTYDTINAETVEQKESLKNHSHLILYLVHYCIVVFMGRKMEKKYPESHKKHPEYTRDWYRSHVYQLPKYMCTQKCSASGSASPLYEYLYNTTSYAPLVLYLWGESRIPQSAGRLGLGTVRRKYGHYDATQIYIKMVIYTRRWFRWSTSATTYCRT